MYDNTNNTPQAYLPTLFSGWLKVVLFLALVLIVIGLVAIFWDLSDAAFAMTTGDGVGALVIGLVVFFGLALGILYRVTKHNKRVAAYWAAHKDQYNAQ